MKQAGAKFATVDAYIASFPPVVQKRLELIRKTIRKSVPEVQEKISYGIPTFTLDGNLIHYAAYSNHIGIYPGSAAIKAFKKDLAGYRTSKGTIQLPSHAEIPCSLIERIVRFQVNDRASGRKPKRKK